MARAEEQLHIIRDNVFLEEQPQEEPEYDLMSIRNNLVDIMPSFPALWNTSLRSYKDLNKKEASWKELSSKLNVHIDVLKKEWAKLRDNFRKTLSKREKAMRSGAGNKKMLPTCNYFTELSFLRDSLSNRTCESNIPSTILNPLSSPLGINEKFDMENHNINDDLPGISPMTSPSNSSCSSSAGGTGYNQYASTPSLNSRKRKPPSDESADIMLIKAIDRHLNPPTIEPQVLQEKNEDNDNRLFCLSLVETLKSMDAKKNAMARVKIQQALFEVKFET